ncbi:MAG: tRNA (adenosine(37)-N6)-threonylcarbamoyltransferase complex transferase subunit TsaD [Firmicutes bacterium]|nr:tRNA (adenosine(37)-N6)-threonylcarbamoyltransferase complex transferase subunit TsaD [Bacillota bacterium]
MIMKNGKHLTMGIESSCDETAIAVLADGREVLSNVISSQIEIHKVYGGVVPEIASRHHLHNIPFVFDQALEEAGVSLDEIDEIGVTAGPGLAGALLMGTAYAKAVAMAAVKPLVGVHHIQGHIMANLIEHPNLKPPFLSLVVSGGHTSLIEVRGYNDFKVLGETRDDAVGEAYDKVARLLGLGYPGGPKVDKLAKEGNPHAIEFKRVYLEKDSYDFSFSGTKTAVINYLHTEEQKGHEINRADVAASFQKAVVEVVVNKAVKAAELSGYPAIALAGGVASNSELRKELAEACKKHGLKLYIPSPIFCTDNGAMIAAAAYRKAMEGKFADLRLDVWPALDLEKETYKLDAVSVV